jgi:hypothetical protein
MSAPTHRNSAVTRRHSASIQRRLNEPVIDQALKTILCPTRAPPLYVGALPGISAGKDVNSSEVARRGSLADAARARGSAIRATDGMLRRQPARRGPAVYALDHPTNPENGGHARRSRRCRICYANSLKSFAPPLPTRRDGAAPTG